MTEHHDLRILGRLAAAEQHQPAKDPNDDEVEQAKGRKSRSCRNQPIRLSRRSPRLRRVLNRYRHRIRGVAGRNGRHRRPLLRQVGQILKGRRSTTERPPLPPPRQPRWWFWCWLAGPASGLRERCRWPFSGVAKKGQRDGAGAGKILRRYVS